MSDRPVRPQIVRAVEMQTTDHPRITTSSEFREFILQRKREAERRKEDLLTEVERLNTEVDARHIEVEEENDIIMRCDAALTIELTRK